MAGWCFRVLILISLQRVSSPICPSGTHFSSHPSDTDGRCISCPNTGYMTAGDHKEEWCKTCEKIKDPDLEILVSPCNKTHDAVIHCVEGYYRVQARNLRETGTCQKCTNCSDYDMYTGHPCSTYNDTCCLSEKDDAESSNDDEPKCIETSLFCRLGHYFDNGFKCLPCPNNTFMPLDIHVRPECFKCREYTPPHSVIVEPCASTHDTVLKCEDGFYVTPTKSRSSDIISCSPCTVCNTTDQYEGRKCDGIHDTVCCPQANMTVEGTPDDLLCMLPNQTAVATTGTTPKQVHDSTNAFQESHVLYIIIGILGCLTLLILAAAYYFRKRCPRSSHKSGYFYSRTK